MFLFLKVLNLTPTDLQQVARHFGHTFEVHQSYYRQHDELIEKSKIAKLLMLSEDGNMNTQKGKKLEEVEVPELMEVMDRYQED